MFVRSGKVTGAQDALPSRVLLRRLFLPVFRFARACSSVYSNGPLPPLSNQDFVSRTSAAFYAAEEKRVAINVQLVASTSKNKRVS